MLARSRTLSSSSRRVPLFWIATIVASVVLSPLPASARESIGTLVFSADSYRYKADSGITQEPSTPATETREALTATLHRLEASFVVNFATLECGVAPCMKSAAFHGFFGQPRSVVAVYRPGDLTSGSERKPSGSTEPAAPVEGLFLTLPADRLALIRALAQAYPASVATSPTKYADCAEADDRCVVAAIVAQPSYRIRQRLLPDAVAGPDSIDGTQPALSTAPTETPSGSAAPRAVDRSRKIVEAKAAEAHEREHAAAAVLKRRADAAVRKAKAEKRSAAKNRADLIANLPASRRLAYASLLRCASTSDAKACFTAGMTANANANADSSLNDLAALCEDRYVDISSQVELAAAGKVPFSNSHASFIVGQLQRMATLCPSESAWALRMRRIIGSRFSR